VSLFVVFRFMDCHDSDTKVEGSVACDVSDLVPGEDAPTGASTEVPTEVPTDTPTGSPVTLAPTTDEPTSGSDLTDNGSILIGGNWLLSFTVSVVLCALQVLY